MTWLPLATGRAPVVSAVSSENECSLALTKPVASAEQHSQTPKSSSAKQHSPSRRSYQGGAVVSVREGKASRKRVRVEPVGGKPEPPARRCGCGRARPHEWIASPMGARAPTKCTDKGKSTRPCGPFIGTDGNDLKSGPRELEKSVRGTMLVSISNPRLAMD